MFADDAGRAKVLACLIKSPNFARVAGHHVRPTHFEGVIDRNMAKIILDYIREFGSCITADAYERILADELRKKTITATKEDVARYGARFRELSSIDTSDWEFTLKQTILFIKNAEWRRFIEDAVTKLLPKDNFEEIEKRASQLNQIQIGVGATGYDLFSDDALYSRAERRAREVIYRERRILEPGAGMGISTGIARLDKALNKNGWCKRNLYLMMAPPKRGKSMALYYFAQMAAAQDIDVALFSCENGLEVIEDRFDAMVSGITMVGLTEQFKEAWKRLKERRPPGKITVFEYPTVRLTCSEVRRQVEHLNAVGSRPVGMVVVDYLDIMKPEYRREDRLIEEADIGKGLRALGTELDVPVLSATQVNRSGSDKALITGRDVRGTWDKIADADVVITFSATDDELKAGNLRIHISESRTSPSTTFMIKTSYNFGKFYSEFIKDE